MKKLVISFVLCLLLVQSASAYMFYSEKEAKSFGGDTEKYIQYASASIKAYDDAITKDSNNALLYYERGDVKYKLYNVIMETFMSAVQKKSFDAQLFSSFESNLPHIFDIISDFSSAVALDPKNNKYKNALKAANESKKGEVKSVATNQKAITNFLTMLDRDEKTLMEMKDKLKDVIKKLDSDKENKDAAKKIFEYLGIQVKENQDKTLTISSYRQPKGFTFKDLGINEQKLLKNVTKITGDADFDNSQITFLWQLQSIGGWANFNGSQITFLGQLQSIGGNARFDDSQVKNLGLLQSIGKNAYFRNSQVKDLGQLQSIGWGADFHDSQITSLGQLQSIGGDASFRNTKIKNLGKLKSIGGDVYLKGSLLKKKDFKNIEFNGDFI